MLQETLKNEDMTYPRSVNICIILTILFFAGIYQNYNATWINLKKWLLITEKAMWSHLVSFPTWEITEYNMSIEKNGINVIQLCASQSYKKGSKISPHRYPLYTQIKWYLQFPTTSPSFLHIYSSLLKPQVVKGCFYVSLFTTEPFNQIGCPHHP